MGATLDYRFPKEGRLHHRSLVERLFRSGKSFYEFPFRVVWQKLTEEEIKKNFRGEVPSDVGRLQLLVVVPKKKRKRAVDRVLMRRRIREAYRLHRIKLQHRIEQTENIGTLSIGLLYSFEKNMPYASIAEKIKKILEKVEAKAIEKDV